MPVTIHCPHDNAELSLEKDERTPEGLLTCPKCKCTFRVCLARFDMKCYAKQYPRLMGAEPKKEPKKRGRHKKVDENVPS
jgi:hypothetical protein